MPEDMTLFEKAQAVQQWLMVMCHFGAMAQSDPEEFASREEWLAAWERQTKEAEEKLSEPDKAACDRMACQIVEFVSGSQVVPPC